MRLSRSLSLARPPHSNVAVSGSMSLVGNYQQHFRSTPEAAYSQQAAAHYYGYDLPAAVAPTSVDSTGAYHPHHHLGWSFGGCYSPDASSSPGGKDYCCGGARPEKGFKKRVTANRKERRRTLSINNAFAELRECIPNVPSDTKLSKIKTLRLATSYIEYLMDLLAQDDPARAAPQGGFKAELCKKFESREERRKRELANLTAGPNGDRKSKGRTGWPQHVWALELKSDT